MALSSDVHWRLDTQESVRSYRNFQVTGQFPTDDDGITWNLSSVIPDAGSLGHEHPVIQWVRGEIQDITLPVVYFSRHKDEDIKPWFNSFLKLKERDKLLKRAPICRFTFGSIVSVLCQVQSLGAVKIYRPRTDGKARRIDLTVVLRRYVPYKVKEIDNTKPKKESLYHTVGRHERSWEMLAARLYGPESVLWGDRLRKRNRDQAFAADIGEEVKIPNREIVIAELIEPEWHGFKRGDENAERVVLNKFVARNALYIVRNRQ